jgi:hypothetical protein
VIPDHRWLVVTVKSPTALVHNDDESWYLAPLRRYLMTANLVDKLGQAVDRVTELASSAHYRPLNALDDLRYKDVLVLRHMDRGLGDLLFMTGVLRYLQHVSAGTCRAHFYADLDKSQVLLGCPEIVSSAAMSGPVEYDHLPLYSGGHFLVETATEYDHEQDQLNVYDALFKKSGVDFSNVDPQFKRPSAAFLPQDQQVFDAVCRSVYELVRIDLRAEGYYVVSPITTSSLRVVPYATWLDLIEILARERPVLVIGQTYSKTPKAGGTVADFICRVDELAASTPRVHNLVNLIPIRTAMALLKFAKCLFCLDSGPLYMAQAYRTPAVSAWGTHHPGVRLGYDEAYMNLAIFKPETCPMCPCYAHTQFPSMCPTSSQLLCAPLCALAAADFVEKLEQVKRTWTAGPFKAAVL